MAKPVPALEICLEEPDLIFLKNPNEIQMDFGIRNMLSQDKNNNEMS
jgi:hypothetical protein